LKGLKEALNMNNSSLYKALNKLEFYQIITKNKKFIRVDLTKKESELLFEIIEFDKKKFNNLDPKTIEIILNFLSRIDSNVEVKQILLFGSYAKHTNSVSSDIDLAIISSEKIDLFEHAYSIEEKYGKKIELHHFTENEFKKSSKLIEEIKRDGIELL